MTGKSVVNEAAVPYASRPMGWPRWLDYVLAVLFSVATLFVRMEVAGLFENRPLLIILVLPIIASALLGGLGPGLFATLLVAVGVDYLIFPPIHSLIIQQTHDLVQLGFLVLNGVMVSVLAEQTRHAWRQRVDALADRLKVAQQLEAIFETSSDAIVGKDGKGIITSWNRGAEHIFGYGAEEAVGQPISLLWVPGDEKQAHIVHEQIRRGEAVPPFEVQCVRKDGAPITVSVALSALRNADGQVMGTSMIGRDMTAARAMRETLREREELFRTLVNQAEEAIELIDAKTMRFVEVGDAACRLLGYRREEMVGLPLAAIEARLTEADLAACCQRVRESGGARFETGHRCKDGSILDAQVSLRLIQLRGRDYFLGIWRDVTEAKRAETALRDTTLFLRESQSIAHLGGWKANPVTGQLFWTEEVYRLVEHPLEHPPASLDEGLAWISTDHR
jgi:PAS domain S-box-containing protein